MRSQVHMQARITVDMQTTNPISPLPDFTLVNVLPPLPNLRLFLTLLNKWDNPPSPIYIIYLRGEVCGLGGNECCRWFQAGLYRVLVADVALEVVGRYSSRRASAPNCSSVSECARRAG